MTKYRTPRALALGLTEEQENAENALGEFLQEFGAPTEVNGEYVWPFSKFINVCLNVNEAHIVIRLNCAEAKGILNTNEARHKAIEDAEPLVYETNFGRATARWDLDWLVENYVAQ